MKNIEYVTDEKRKKKKVLLLLVSFLSYDG